MCSRSRRLPEVSGTSSSVKDVRDDEADGAFSFSVAASTVEIDYVFLVSIGS